MKLLLDACVWGGARDALSAAGHDVVWAGDWPEDPGDEEILNRASASSRTIVTLDKDFGELAIIRSVSHRGIVRLVGIAARLQGSRCVDALGRYGDALTKGAIVTVEPTRVRIRPPGE